MKKKPRFIVDSPERYRYLEKKLSANARFEPTTKYVAAFSASDEDIFSAADTNDRHILTQNPKDFIRIQKAKPQSKIAIVGFDPHITTPQLVGYLRKELAVSRYHENFYQKSIMLGSKKK